MIITSLQAQIVREMKNQGADKQTINGIMTDLTTEEQQKQMLKYLVSIRQKTITKSEVIEKALEISQE